MLFRSFGDIQSKLRVVENELHSLDLAAEVNALQESDKDRRKLRVEFWRLSRALEWIWMQKSRLNWAQKGGLNTRLFHVIPNGRQRKNSLEMVEGLRNLVRY